MQGDHESRSTQGRERSDQLIAAAVAAAETRSAAEIAVALVPRAEPYRLTAMLAAVMIFALVDMIFGWRGDVLTAWAVSVIGAGVTNWLGPIIAVLLAIVLFLACEHTSLGVMLTPPALRRQACLARARLLFLDHGIDATEDRLGLLICVCEAERHIEILPDRGIAAAIPAERWATLIGAFRDHKQKVPLEAALVQLIALVADELAPRFPFWAGQSNELPDRPFRV
jgi:putative membrane protein